MESIIHAMESAVEFLAKSGSALVELAGIIILLISAVQGVIAYFKRSPHTRLNLAQGIALSLEFKMGGEVLRTVVARDWNELLILGAIILLRAALTLLLHWEIKNEETRTSGELPHPILKKKAS